MEEARAATLNATKGIGSLITDSKKKEGGGRMHIIMRAKNTRDEIIVVR